MYNVPLCATYPGSEHYLDPNFPCSIISLPLGKNTYDKISVIKFHDEIPCIIFLFAQLSLNPNFPWIRLFLVLLFHCLWKDKPAPKYLRSNPTKKSNAYCSSCTTFLGSELSLDPNFPCFIISLPL